MVKINFDNGLAVDYVLANQEGIFNINICWSFSAAQSCLTLWDLMDCNMPGFPVLENSWRFPEDFPLPEDCSNSCPLRWWCHPTILSIVFPFSSCLQSFPASGFILMSQFFESGGESIEVSTLASVLPMNIQDWFPLGWTDLISVQSIGLSRVFCNTTV